MNGLPTIDVRRVEQDVLELEFTLAADCVWFAGHFPDRPILPGVVQVGWAAHFAAEWANHDTPPTQIRRLKFKRPLLPDARVGLRLQRQGAAIGFEYRLADSGQWETASCGRLGFGEPA